MRIPSGVTDQYIYFVAVDSTDLKTRETGLTTFTVYRSRNGAAAAAMTTPTVNEVDATNMPGVYELLLDEDMTIGSGNDSEEMCFHITQASMAPVTRTIELYRPKITAGNTLGVAADGDVSGNVDGNVVGSVASVTANVTFDNTSIATVTNLTNLPSIPANWLTAAGIDASALNGKGDWNTTTPLTASGIRAAVGLASANLDTQIGLTALESTVGGLNNISAADVWAAATRTLTAGTNLNDIAASDILTTQLTESYAANGVAPTLVQAIFAIHQMLMDFSISGTAITVEKLDGTTAFSVTLDDGSDPTSANRA